MVRGNNTGKGPQKRNNNSDKGPSDPKREKEEKGWWYGETGNCKWRRNEITHLPTYLNSLLSFPKCPFAVSTTANSLHSPTFSPLFPRPSTNAAAANCHRNNRTNATLPPCVPCPCTEISWRHWSHRRFYPCFKRWLTWIWAQISCRVWMVWGCWGGLCDILTWPIIKYNIYNLYSLLLLLPFHFNIPEYFRINQLNFRPFPVLKCHCS